MTQQEIDDAVCTATGEDLCEIQRHGFSIADPLEVAFDPEPDHRPPLMVDWDDVELRRNIAVFDQPRSSLRRVT